MQAKERKLNNFLISVVNLMLDFGDAIEQNRSNSNPISRTFSTEHRRKVMWEAPLKLGSYLISVPKPHNQISFTGIGL